MIVAGTNLIAYLLLPGDRSDISERVLQADPEWLAPLLWRTEFRNILATLFHRGDLEVRDAFELIETAEELMRGRERLVTSREVLSLSQHSGCSAYDCEFVALASQLRAPLVTSDKRLLDAFEPLTVSPETFVAS